MTKLLSLLVVAVALISSPLAFAESQQEAEAQCKQWAQEENVSSEEMADYMADCLATQTPDATEENK